jgi:hypothetical protein
VQPAAAVLLSLTRLLEWLREQGQGEGAASIARVSALLDVMLQESQHLPQPHPSWQLYELLLQLQQQPAWQQQQATGLSVKACDALILQQQEPEHSADSAARVLQLLLHSAGHSSSGAGLQASVQCYEQLSSSSQQAVLAAAVRLGHHEEVLQLALQTGAAEDTFQQLLNLWQGQQHLPASAAAAAAAAISAGSGGKQLEAAAAEVDRDYGSPPAATVLLAATEASLQLQSVPAVTQLLQLLQRAAAGSSLSQLLTSQQVEQCVQLLCLSSGTGTGSQAAWEAAQQLVNDCLLDSAVMSGVARITATTVASYAAAAAAVVKDSTTCQQQLQRMAGPAVLVQAIRELASKADAAGTVLLLEAVLSGIASQQLQTQEVLQCLTGDSLQQLLGLLCRDSNSMPAAEQLVRFWMCTGGRQLPQAAAIALLDAYGKHRSALQPGSAAVLLGAVSFPQLAPATVNSNSQQQQQQAAAKGSADACRSSTELIAQICAGLSYPATTPGGPAAAAAAGAVEDTAWVDDLSSPAAAAALFSCWFWQQPTDPGLLLLLYSRARQGPGSAKPSLEGLLLDLGLAAAGRAADWHTGRGVLTVNYTWYDLLSSWMQG